MLFLLVLAAAPLHTRWVTDNGPVHVAIPPRPSNLTVVYVHGFWNDVDEAWEQHDLQNQLLATGAVVIAPEAPSGPGQAVRWPSLSALLAEVEARTGAKLPEHVVAIGHSGAYRTVGAWVSEPRLTDVVLLDAFYGGARPWERFVARGGTLRVVARSTAKQSAPFCARHPEVKCELSPLSHMRIVTSGEVIPRVLREVAALRTPDA